MKLKHLLFAFFVLVFSTNYAQYDPDYNDQDEEDLSLLSFKDRLYTGGTFWASFGSSLGISPLLGYRITNDYSVGVGIKYNYFKRNVAPAFSASIYGGSAFTRYIFLERIVAHAEFELLSIQQSFGLPSSDRIAVPIGLVGGGFSSNGSQLMLLYDLIGHPNNPYRGTFGSNSRIYLRAGFLINL